MLDSPAALQRLSAAAGGGAHLLPMGTTAWEQRLAEASGLPLAVPDAATFARVNSKIYGRRLAARAACVRAGRLLRDRRRVRRDPGRLPAAGSAPAGLRIVVKDAYGVSGKGLVVLDSPVKRRQSAAHGATARRATGDQRLHVVVEEWLPKQCDLNYQVTIARDGRINLDFVKQALTENGVHKGHVMPPRADRRPARRDRGGWRDRGRPAPAR